MRADPRARLRRFAAKALTGGLLLFCRPDTVAAGPGESSLFRQVSLLEGVEEHGPEGARCGEAIAEFGGAYLVGCPGYRLDGVEQGVVLVFAEGLVATVTASDGAAGDEFGAAIDTASGYVVVGAPGRGAQKGAAYVFKNRLFLSPTPFPQIATLEASDGAPGDRFGEATTGKPGLILVGAPGSTVASADRAGAVYTFAVSNDVVAPSYILTAPVPEEDSGFGAAIGIATDFEDGTHVLIGAPRAARSSAGSGAVFAFLEGISAWAFEQELAPATDRQEFGSAITTFRSWTVIGAPGGHDQPGAITTFQHHLTGGWLRLDERTGPPPAGSDFGAALSLWDSDTLLIGAPAEALAEGGGAVYEYRRSTENWESWTLVRRIVAGPEQVTFGSAITLKAVGDPRARRNGVSTSGSVHFFEEMVTGLVITSSAGEDTRDFDLFGQCLAIDSNGDILVSSPRDDHHLLPDPGSVSVFRRSGEQWTFLRKVIADDAGALDHFGSDLALGDQYLVAAANGDSLSSHRGPAVYVFRRDGDAWPQIARLTGDVLDLYFGHSVAVLGSTIVVGAPGARSDPSNPNSAPTGAVFVYHCTPASCSLEQRIVPTVVEGVSNFGYDVSIAGERIVISAPTENNERGALYFFRHESNWTQEERRSPLAVPGEFWGIYLAFDGLSVAASYGQQVLTLEPSSEGWSEQLLRASAGWPDQFLTGAVALAPETLVAGASSFFSVDPWTGSHDRGGAGLIYRRSEGAWRPWQVVRPNPIVVNEGMGSSVAASEDLAVVGSYAGRRVAVFAAQPPSGSFFSLSPCRLADTRVAGQGPALVHGISRSFRAIGSCGIPATAKSLVLNVTITQADGNGHLVLHAASTPVPSTSNISFATGQTRANNAIVAVGPDGVGDLRIVPIVTGEFGTVHVILDVTGYFE